MGIGLGFQWKMSPENVYLEKRLMCHNSPFSGRRSDGNLRSGECCRSVQCLLFGRKSQVGRVLPVCAMFIVRTEISGRASVAGLCNV